MCEESFETVVGCMVEKLKQMLVPTGTVIIRPTTVVPDDFLECNGAEISRVDYAALFEVIGTTYGAGDGVETFNLPDLRGEFIRGFDNSRGVDVDREVGSWQTDGIKRHIHAGLNNSPYGNGYDYKFGYDATADSIVTGGGGSFPTLPVSSKHDNNRYTAIKTNETLGGIEETRPRNIAMMYCIKY